MSKLGKVFCVIAMVLSVVSAVLGFLVAKSKSGYMTQLQTTEDALRTSPMAPPYSADYKTSPDEPATYINSLNKAFKNTKDELKGTQEKLTGAETKLADSETKVQDLTTKEASAKRDLESKSKELTEAQAKLGQSETKLKAVLDDLGGREAKQIVADLKASTETAGALEREKKILQDAIAQKSAEIAKYQDLDKLREKGYAPDDLSGKVMAINKAWNFVVLDIGKDNRLVEGVELVVYRGDTMIGKVRSVSVDATSAVADILPDWTKTEIQVGDKVLFGYK